MRVEVDRERCEGHGMCERTAPEIFRLDDEGELEILVDEVPSDLQSKAVAATMACPMAALNAKT